MHCQKLSSCSSVKSRGLLHPPSRIKRAKYGDETQSKKRNFLRANDKKFLVLQYLILPGRVKKNFCSARQRNQREVKIQRSSYFPDHFNHFSKINFFFWRGHSLCAKTPSCVDSSWYNTVKLFRAPLLNCQFWRPVKVRPSNPLLFANASTRRTRE